jgi:hypothetical protein
LCAAQWSAVVPSASLLLDDPNLLFIKGINYVQNGPKSCGHAEACVQTLTGLGPGSTGNTAYASGASADTLIAKALNAPDPLALYSGSKGFIAERISFKAAGAGQVDSARVQRSNPEIASNRRNPHDQGVANADGNIGDSHGDQRNRAAVLFRQAQALFHGAGRGGVELVSNAFSDHALGIGIDLDRNRTGGNHLTADNDIQGLILRKRNSIATDMTKAPSRVWRLID